MRSQNKTGSLITLNLEVLLELLALYASCVGTDETGALKLCGTGS